jgi:hypothetical protein
MSRELVQTAAKLLAKAESTTSDHEAIALVERSYALLAQAINAYDVANASGPRRRERRRLHERRRRARAESTSTNASPDTVVRTNDPLAGYRAVGDTGRSRRRGIDVVL